jgi:hypothetical protein
MGMNVKQFRSIAEKQVVIRGMIQDPGVDPEMGRWIGAKVLVQVFVISSRIENVELAGMVSYSANLEQPDPFAYDVFHKVPTLNSSFPGNIDDYIWRCLNYWDVRRGPWSKPMQCVVAHEFHGRIGSRFEEYRGVPLCVLLNLARILEWLRGKMSDEREIIRDNRCDLVIAQDLYARITGFLSEQQKRISNAANELSGLLS